MMNLALNESKFDLCITLGLLYDRKPAQFLYIYTEISNKSHSCFVPQNLLLLCQNLYWSYFYTASNCTACSTCWVVSQITFAISKFPSYLTSHLYINMRKSSLLKILYHESIRKSNAHDKSHNFSRYHAPQIWVYRRLLENSFFAHFTSSCWKRKQMKESITWKF